METVKSIPLSTRLPIYKLIWAETNNGLFTVKSAYKVAVDILAASPLGSSGSSSNESNMKRFWKLVWKLDVPHKIRHFVWRACRDILPTKRILKNQQILVEDICAKCNLDSETTGHVFGLVLELKIFGNALGFSNLVLLVYSLLFLTCYGKR